MSEVNLTVEIHCLKPSWVNYENNRYRLYVNDDLITERTWIWGSDTCIDENFYVDLIPGNFNSMRLETVPQANSVVEFEMRNFRINSFSRPVAKSEITFKV